MMEDVFFAEKQDSKPIGEKLKREYELTSNGEVNTEINSRNGDVSANRRNLKKMIDERKLGRIQSRLHQRNSRRLRPIDEAEEEVASLQIEIEVLECEIGKVTKEKNGVVEESVVMLYENQNLKSQFQESQLHWLKENNKLLKRVVRLQNELMSNQTQETQTMRNAFMTGAFPSPDDFTEESESEEDEDLVVD